MEFRYSLHYDYCSYEFSDLCLVTYDANGNELIRVLEEGSSWKCPEDVIEQYRLRGELDELEEYLAFICDETETEYKKIIESIA